ncbi:chemotaxis protein MotB [Gammaproteobacteria bacterium]
MAEARGFRAEFRLMNEEIPERLGEPENRERPEISPEEFRLQTQASTTDPKSVTPPLAGVKVITNRGGPHASGKASHSTTRRKKHAEEHENHERWLVSYADFITLLFAFFVVMYAISSVNEGKYQVLFNSMGAAFHSVPRSIKPIQIGEEKPELSRIPKIIQNENETADQQDLNLISDKIEKSLADFIKKDLIGVRRDKLWLEVEIKTSILFPSGSTSLERNALPILTDLAEILKNFPNSIQVGGFTDDKPISSVSYPSNWELSAGRAASVVHLFNKLGVNPERMSAVGYGEHRPMADNSTPEGRNKNRRVVLHILAAHSDQP